MKRIISLLVIGFLISCGTSKDSAKKADGISGVWSTQAIFNDSIAELKKIHPQDRFVLNADSTFHYYLKMEMTYATGKWSMEDTTLILDYDYIPSSAGVDSVQITPSGLVNYYVGPSPVKRMGLSKSMTRGKNFDQVYRDARNISRSKRRYEVVYQTADSLLFQEDGISFAYKR